MMVIVDFYLACTALVLMMMEDAPLLNEAGLPEQDDKTAANRLSEPASQP